MRSGPVRHAAPDDLSDGRVPAAVAIVQGLSEVQRARRDAQVAGQRARENARAVLARVEAARAAGWTDDQLAAAGLHPSPEILDLAHQPDDPEV